MVIDTETKTVEEYSEKLESRMLSIGDKRYIYSFDSNSSLPALTELATSVVVNEENRNYFAVDDGRDEPDIQFAVVDNNGGNLIMVKQFWINKSADTVVTDTADFPE